MDLTKIFSGSKTERTTETSAKEQAGKKATDLLEEDHDNVRALFKSYREAEDGGAREKGRLFRQIDRELSLHADAEEQVFYPAVRQVDDEKATKIVLESREEHAIVKTLLAQLRALEPGDETFDAKMKVLMEGVEHHADEEEDDMFPQAERLGDEELVRLGARIAARKAEMARGLRSATPSRSKTKRTRSSAKSSSARKTAARKSARKAAPSRKAGSSRTKAGSSRKTGSSRTKRGR